MPEPAPALYDPTSPWEQVVPLPSAPLIVLAANTVLQPPLTHRSTGPGLIAFLPPPSALESAHSSGEPKPKPIDPEPVQKWAEEGFAVVGATIGGELDGGEAWSVKDVLEKGVDALLVRQELDTKDKFAVLGMLCASFTPVDRSRESALYSLRPADPFPGRRTNRLRSRSPVHLSCIIWRLLAEILRHSGADDVAHSSRHYPMSSK